MVRKGFTRGGDQSLTLKNEHKFAKQRNMPGCERPVGSDQGLHLARSGAKWGGRGLEWPAGTVLEGLEGSGQPQNHPEEGRARSSSARQELPGALGDELKGARLDPWRQRSLGAR